MIFHQKHTVRHVGLLFVQRIFLIVGGFVFAIFIPRLMGPEQFGRYVLLTSLSLIFILFSTLGFRQVVTRFIPQFILDQSVEELKLFYSRLVTIRFFAGLVFAVFFLVVTLIGLDDIDRNLLILFAGVVFVRAMSQIFFNIHIGFNQASRWGIGEVLRLWISILLVILGYRILGLRGACVGLLLAECVVCFVGFYGVKSYLTRPFPLKDFLLMKSYFRFGLIFFLSSLFISLFLHSSEILLRIFTDNYADIGYLGIAFKFYLIIVVAITHLVNAFTPLLVKFIHEDNEQLLQQWIGRLIKINTLIGMLIFLGTLFLARDLVPLIMGKTYQPVAEYLIPLTISFLFIGFSSVAYLITMLYNKPDIAAKSTGIRLFFFVGLSIPLISWKGGLGICYAALAATVFDSIYIWVWTRKLLAYSVREWVLPIVAVIPFIPLVLLKTGFLLNVVLFIVYIVVYLSLCYLLKIVHPREMNAVFQAFSTNKESSREAVLQNDIDRA